MKEIYYLLAILLVIGRTIEVGATFIAFFPLKFPLEKEGGALARELMTKYGSLGLLASWSLGIAFFLLPAQILITATSVLLTLLRIDKVAEKLPYIVPLVWVGLGTLLFWSCGFHNLGCIFAKLLPPGPLSKSQ